MLPAETVLATGVCGGSAAEITALDTSVKVIFQLTICERFVKYAPRRLSQTCIVHPPKADEPFRDSSACSGR